MEVLTAPSIRQKFQLFSSVSPLTLNSTTFPKRFRITPLRNSFCPSFYLKTPQFSSSHLPNRPNLQILSRLGHPKRRNSLRKKLSHEKLVRDNSEELKQLDSSLSYDNLEDSSLSNVEKLQLLPDSVFSTTLENWDNQYKEDLEFWGIGSCPIFTVFHDLDGNVKRVSVCEEEIVRRTRVEGEEDFKGVELKIARAKCLAREIENGEYVIPNNSSIARFVVLGKQSSFVNFINGVRSVNLRPNMLSKRLQIGLALICGCFIFWSIKKILEVGSDDRVELTMVDKEMLRRKMRSRAEKEKMEKGSVEVIEDVIEPFVGSIERPRLDKQKLLNDFLRAKASREKSALSISSSVLDAKSRDFNDKIQEIQEMARHAREIEHQERVAEGKVDEEHEDANKEPSHEPEDTKVCDNMELSFLNNPSDLDSVKLMGISSTTKSSYVNRPQTENIGSDDSPLTLKKEPLVNGVEDSRIGRNSSLEDMDEEIQYCDTPSDYSHFPNKSSVEVNPSVIRPVQEKKEILSKKHDRKLEYKEIDRNAEAGPLTAKDSWTEQNFQELEPIVKKIRTGFSKNYMVAKDKEEEELCSDINQLRTDDDDGELDWMKDDGLREIVFQVRENELMGRDPFYMMDAEDKRAFFEGLERKVERTNAKLASLHEYVHSMVENLDYGADGISLYDSPEKIIPHWKGPPVEKDPDFLNNLIQQRREFFDEMGISLVNEDAQDSVIKSVQPPVGEDSPPSSAIHIGSSNNGVFTNPKTVIECSDGSTRAGTKSGKEYWQHTKKWSQEFLETYNAETDPEVKSVMKDIGKDLDRWISEKEVQETADLMSKMPKKKRRYIEKKLDKLKNEMETYGPQAVVSKYREYAEEKEEDYLWWLDLPHVLCIELYTSENGSERIGFYSLEMAIDLDLNPKQYHVIAFEDPGDCKNFCYIIQAHMETLGNGNAFVIARPPKDTFREAKANGFSVTVIRKAELQLNVDQTLEEVEEQMMEIGSKMYHERIMRDRSVDMGSLIKGVLGTKKSPKR
ncbi:hypothetical protein GIB67_001566 [Kingdonia uniflora]|uniref:Embryo defective 1703 n=1 Tax=Kingdonia uniflora TaxID=39325 RepID=A0A7J7L0Q0_9MAGN|nr:hypothetical protein GIB67_001566 [Kingdonia uniflora]